MIRDSCHVSLADVGGEALKKNLLLFLQDGYLDKTFGGKIITMVQAWSIIAWAPGDIRRPDLTVFSECEMRPIGTGDLGNYLDISYVQSK